MINTALMTKVSVDDLIEMGFIEHRDGTGDPRGTDWHIKNDNFHLYIDAWFEVFLSRVNPDTDPITVHATDKQELQTVVDWIAD